MWNVLLEYWPQHSPAYPEIDIACLCHAIKIQIFFHENNYHEEAEIVPHTVHSCRFNSPEASELRGPCNSEINKNYVILPPRYLALLLTLPQLLPRGNREWIDRVPSSSLYPLLLSGHSIAGICHLSLPSNHLPAGNCPLIGHRGQE